MNCPDCDKPMVKDGVEWICMNEECPPECAKCGGMGLTDCRCWEDEELAYARRHSAF